MGSKLKFLNGTASGGKDDGKIIDKELLPIKKIYIGGLIGYQRMTITLGPVTCGPKPFGIYFHFLTSSMH
jgi:hypothetical protein